jgi:hypothetical protein
MYGIFGGHVPMAAKTTPTTKQPNAHSAKKPAL